MKWATFLLALILSLPLFVQYPGDPSETVSIHGTIPGLTPGSMCSAELRSAYSGFSVQRVQCGPAGFEFTDIPRGNYLIVVETGLNEMQQQVEADMPNTQLEIRLPSHSSGEAHSGSTVSVSELMVPEKARDLFKKASDLMQHSKFNKAEEKLQQALAIAPRYARAWALQAVIAAQGKDLTSALKYADSAVTADAQLPYAQFIRAMVLNASGRFKEASVAASQGLRIDASSWQGHFELAHALFGLGDLSRAMSEVTQAEAIAPPDFPDVHLLKVMILMKSNLFQQARQELNGIHKDGEHDTRIRQLDAMIAQRLMSK